MPKIEVPCTQNILNIYCAINKRIGKPKGSIKNPATCVHMDTVHVLLCVHYTMSKEAEEQFVANNKLLAGMTVFGSAGLWDLYKNLGSPTESGTVGNWFLQPRSGEAC